MTTEALRPVRVTIVGQARPVGHAPNLLHVEYAGCATIVDADSPDVVVEDVQPARRWTDGDVVLTDGDIVWTRDKGEWHTPGGIGTLTDAEVDTAFTYGDATQVRYQAGG